MKTDRTAEEKVLGDLARERDEKQAALSDYDRLGDVSRLQRLVAEADTIWPAAPSMVPALKTWVEQGVDLEKRLARHKEALERIRVEALSAGAANGQPEAAAAESRAGAAAESAPAADHRTWSFASSADQFKHDTIARLVADLTAFVDPDPTKGLLANVRQRLAFAESVQHETIEKYKTEWGNAIRSIADSNECPKYKGLKIRPQLGLIPIGRNLSSGLWEFSHLQSIEPGAEPIPLRLTDGTILPAESMGLVFVLIPGGTFRMGAAKPAEGQALTDPNVDPEADEDESPVTEVRLDPFFLSKYEMTQAQWLRLVGENPSGFLPGMEFQGDLHGGVTLLNPVEQISWEQSDLWLGRLGLILPTEAQWEYAARGATTTPWWTGIRRADLASAANLADAASGKFGPDSKSEPWNDGYSGHAPVGSFLPNPFGLHDVLGNVAEWCRDWYGSYEVPADAGDGLRHPAEPSDRLERGGSLDWDGSHARSASRGRGHPSVERCPGLGVRPARRLLPASPASESR